MSAAKALRNYAGAVSCPGNQVQRRLEARAMPLLFLGFAFVFVSLMWLIWTITLLFWPVALLIAGCVVLRGQMRHWRGFASGRGAFPIGDRPTRSNHKIGRA